MKNELGKTKLEFITFLTLNEKSKNTIDKYSRDIRDFILWIEKECKNITSIEQLNKEILLKYKLYIKNNYDKVSTINSKISAINAFLIFIKKQELTLKVIKCQKSIFGNKEKELSKYELNKLIEATKNDKRIFYLIETIVSTGVRVSEVKFITVETLENGWVSVENKGKTRIVKIPNKLCKLLRDFCKTKNIKNGPIFITSKGKPMHRTYIWAKMKKLCKEAGVSEKKVFPHNLRHLFAREFYKQTKDIVKLASILGHSSIETTRIYTLENEYEIVEIIENLGFIKT